MNYKTVSIKQITLDGRTLEEMGTFTYLGNINNEQGTSDAELRAQSPNAWGAFFKLKNM